MNVPWRDRRGRLLPLKAVTLALAILPGLLWAFWWAHGDLGGRPLNEVIHATGLWAIRFTLIALAITPAVRALRWQRLLLVRRMVGLAALSYASAHLMLYVVDQKFDLLVVGSEILTRTYLTIGFAALLGLLALGVTSTDAAIRRMGRGWKRLHRLAYPIAILALVHYFIQSKANVTEPVLVAGFYVWLMAWRALPERWRTSPVACLALAGLAGVADALIEFAWYASATRIDPWRVLALNASISHGLRPAHWVALVGLGVAVASAARQWPIGRLSAIRLAVPRSQRL